jgi:hypothetical protein
MIAHPDFIDELTELVTFHEGRGLDVRVVNVLDVYDQFSSSIFDPQAIKDYLYHAQANMGTEYVLLVGGDTYDYHDYQGQSRPKLWKGHNYLRLQPQVIRHRRRRS